MILKSKQVFNVMTTMVIMIGLVLATPGTDFAVAKKNANSVKKVTALQPQQSQQSQQPQQPDLGTVKDMKYTNKYFGLGITIPESWQIQDLDSKREMNKISIKVLSGNDKKKQALYEASVDRVQNLLVVLKYPLGQPGVFNPNFCAVAENVSIFKGVINEEIYLSSSKNALKSSPLKYMIDDQYTIETIDGTAFTVMHMSFQVGTITIQQKYYCAKKGNYMLSFIETYSSTDEQAELDNILKSITIAK